MTWRGLVLIALVLLTAAAPALAQSTAPEPSAKPAEGPTQAERDALANQVSLTRAAIQTQRQAIVTEAMDLDPQQTQAFWPLYREYREAMGKVNDRTVKLLSQYLQAYPNLSDATAAQLLDESLSIEEARQQVKRQYVARLRKVLPERQVARFFQVENKLDAIVNAELAERVPLVE
jgi:hypothetical protein